MVMVMAMDFTKARDVATALRRNRHASCRKNTSEDTEMTREMHAFQWKSTEFGRG